MKKILFVYVLLLVAVGAFAVMKGDSIIPQNLFKKAPSATVNGKTFNLLIAKSDKERALGLSKRDKLDFNSGMLFSFEKKGIYPFWMRDMRFPIDIIYIDDSVIVDIIENAPVPKDAGSLASLPIYKPKAAVILVI